MRRELGWPLPDDAGQVTNTGWDEPVEQLVPRGGILAQRHAPGAKDKAACRQPGGKQHEQWLGRENVRWISSHPKLQQLLVKGGGIAENGRGAHEELREGLGCHGQIPTLMTGMIVIGSGPWMLPYLINIFSMIELSGCQNLS